MSERLVGDWVVTVKNKNIASVDSVDSVANDFLVITIRLPIEKC